MKVIAVIAMVLMTFGWWDATYHDGRHAREMAKLSESVLHGFGF